MHIRFYIDPETGLPHTYTAYRRKRSSRRSRTRLSECTGGALFALGPTFAGRHLRVVYRDDGDGIFVITAYNLTGKALKAYRRNRRRRSR